MSTLILLRHGQSMWNQRNIFTGWVDVPLSKEGITEASAAGDIIKDLDIHCIYTSTLVRAQQTAMIALAHHSQNNVPVIMHDNTANPAKYNAFDHSQNEHVIPTHVDWRLNERHYGDLQGLNKQATRDKHGDEQVKLWRRSYDIAPPHGESLAMTCERTLPCFEERIIPELASGKNVLISAHGNSLRSIVMHIESLDESQVLKLEIATGKPLLYTFDSGSFSKENTTTQATA